METLIYCVYRRGHGWPGIVNGCKPLKMERSDRRVPRSASWSGAGVIFDQHLSICCVPDYDIRYQYRANVAGSGGHGATCDPVPPPSEPYDQAPERQRHHDRAVPEQLRRNSPRSARVKDTRAAAAFLGSSPSILSLLNIIIRVISSDSLHRDALLVSSCRTKLMWHREGENA